MKKIQLKEFIHNRYACNCVCFVVVVVVFIAIVVTKEQHQQAKFCCNLWKTTMETNKMLKTIQDEALSCTPVFEWFKRFRQEHEDLKKMIQGVSGCQLLKIWEQLQFMKQ